jgi:hypothetical protein
MELPNNKRAFAYFRLLFGEKKVAPLRHWIPRYRNLICRTPPARPACEPNPPKIGNG